MRTILTALLLLVVVAVTACQSENTGTLEVRLTDAPTDLAIEKAMITISDVSVHLAGTDEATNASNETDSTAGWKTIVSTPQIVDLMRLRNNVSTVLGSDELVAGKYTQVRLSVSKAVVTIDGVEYDLTVPSSSIKLIHPFTIVAGETTTLTLDFDALQSIRETGKGTYKLQPTIKVIQG